MALLDLSLPDSIAVADSVAVELSSYSPSIEDAIAATDAIAVEMSYAVELADALELTDAVAEDLSQVAGEFHREPSDAAEVTDYIEVLLFDGRVHTVTSVSPERGRAGDTITITGTGFAAANNSVRLDGTACTILSQSETEIVITQPTTFNVTEGFAVLQVNNFDNNRFTEVPFYIRPTAATLATRRLYDQQPGPEEFAASAAGVGGTGAVIDSPTRAEARQWERMATMVDFLLRDTLLGQGDMFIRDAVGLAVLDGTTATPVKEPGQKLVADSTQDEGVRWGHAGDFDVPYGLQLASGNTSGTNMVPNGTNTTTTGDTVWASPQSAEIDAVYVYQQSSGGNTDRLDRVRILVNGVQQYDSGTGLNVAHQGRFFAGSLGISVSAGQRVQLEITKTGTSETMDLLGAVRMLAE